MSSIITMKATGNFKKFNSMLERSKELFKSGILDKYGEKGVEALKEATPKDTGLTSESWSYEITHTKNTATITFLNSNIQNGQNIAIVLQYGHATKTGYWINGIDYINPAIQPIFEEMANNALKEATRYE